MQLLILTKIHLTFSEDAGVEVEYIPFELKNGTSGEIKPAGFNRLLHSPLQKKLSIKRIKII